MSQRYDLSGYLLGELDEHERIEIEQAIANDPALRAQVDRLRPVVHQLAELPDDAWDTMLPVDQESHQPRRLRAKRSLGLQRLAAALTAVVVLGIGIAIGVVIEHPSSLHGQTVALRPLPGAPPAARGIATSVNQRRILLTVRRLRPAAPGTYYEVWLMTSTTDLVPIASFEVDASGAASLDVPLPAAPHNYRYIDISLQHISAGLEHSRQSVLRGPTP